MSTMDRNIYCGVFLYNWNSYASSTQCIVQIQGHKLLLFEVWLNISYFDVVGHIYVQACRRFSDILDSAMDDFDGTA